MRLLAACAILAVALGVFFLRVSRDMRDFEVPWTVAGRAAAAEPLYRAEDEHYQFKYLPAFAVLAVPLGMVPLPVAKGIWFVGSVALLFALIAISIRLLPERRHATPVLVLCTMVVLAKFYLRELDLGQVNLLFGVAAAGALLAMKRGREMLAAALLVATIAIKPYGVLLLPLLLVRRRGATTVATIIGVWLLLLLPVPLYGLVGTIDLHHSWWQTVTETTAPNLLNPDNVSLASMYAKWLGMGAWSAALATASAFAVLGGVAIVFLRRRPVPFPEGLEGSLLLLLIPLLSPQGWDYVLLIATPAVVYLANYLDKLPALWRGLTIAAGLTIGLSVFDLMGRAAYAAFMAAAVISVCALVLVGALVRLRLNAEA
jgi:alpha-1,2-mannosyltransferase